MKRIMIIAGVLILLLLIILLNLRGGRGKVNEVEYGVVKRRTIRSTVRAEGEIRARNQVEIGAEVIGKIVSIPVEEGDTVEVGDTLCIIDPKTYEAKLKQVKARLDADYARLIKLEKDLKRMKELLDKELVSPSAYEEILTNYNSLKAQVSADSFALEEAYEDLKKTIITSPIRGEVVAVYKEVGEQVVMGTVNTPGSVIMVLADRSEMLLKALIDETEVVKIKIGQRAEIKVDAYPDSIFKGEVVRIGGVPETSISGITEGVSYPIEILIKSSDTPLFPGMSAAADIIVEEAENTLAIPFSALGRRKFKGKLRDVIFKVEDGKAEMVPVQIGVSDEKWVEIREGVEEGDTIIVGPYKVLRVLEDGEKVKLKEKKFKKFKKR
jgi:HlyD family secretion protein